MRLAYSGARGAPRSTRVTRPAPGRDDGLGVDLSAHYSDLRAIALSSYSKRCQDAAVDVEDLISVAAERILRSNRGAKPFDPSKASLGRYLHLLLASRLSVMASLVRQSESRRSRRAIRLDDDDGEVDELARVEAEPEVGDALRLVEARLPDLTQAARKVDADVADFPCAFLYGGWDGPDVEDQSWSGWREQAIRWVCGECPQIKECAAFWSVNAQEAQRRLDWARDQWIAEIGA
jgi:hypothetical protein